LNAQTSTSSQHDLTHSCRLGLYSAICRAT